MPKFSFPSARIFDPALAALAGLSAGFLVFAMPEALFSGLVETSRLPDFVAAARPPLGETARLVAAATAALAVFAGIWALMHALGRRPAPRVVRARTFAEPAADAPKLRRADAHPDAPARAPLLARDLGEPLDLQAFAEAPVEPRVDTSAAGFEPRPLPAFLVPQAAEPEPAPNPAAESEPEPVESEPLRAEPEPRLERPAEAERPIAELAARLPEAEAEPDQSLSQLVHRIEFGLARKRQALPAGGVAPFEVGGADPDKVGHRLRSAITDLQKIASAGG